MDNERKFDERRTAAERKPLSTSSITAYVMLAKLVVASAVDKHGNELYPYKWNNKFIELPKKQKKKMKRPSISREIMNGLARYPIILYRVLFILLGATGARIGEMLAVEIDKHISIDYRTISIRQKVHEGIVEERLKTEASLRDVDLHPAISELLRWFIGDRKSGFLFSRVGGKPISYQAALDHLHPALRALGYNNGYDESSKAGAHIFRRFRITYLRNFTPCPEGLRTYWLGHANDRERDRPNTDVMGDCYDMIERDRGFRLEMAEKCGFGFELPSLVPMYPNWVQ